MQKKHDQPKIFGHRGAAGLEFENTLASIKKAIDLGVAAIEIDVWQTTDHEIVVFHDAYLDRLTHASGFISELSYAKLKSIPLKNGAEIPTLQAVIELVKPYKIPLLVEVKAENAFAKTLEILESKLPYSDFMIGSFYHQQIMELKRQNPELQTAIMFECVPAFLEDYLQTVNPDYVVTAIETHNSYLVETVKAQNRKLLFYTVNLEQEITLALKAEPYGIITNFPDRLLKVVNDL
ncbi:glycerophosphodiester phosphodiesterase [Adhaeribacter terreus]|uniref:Glycerophosphodiester phosphodiesterase n=1 Tax=Adhaeribacter terreus TaxID=529703 RepID=A0ABW0EEC7_9BACT